MSQVASMLISLVESMLISKQKIQAHSETKSYEQHDLFEAKVIIGNFIFYVSRYFKESIN